MTEIYVLQHAYEDSTGEEDVKMIGVFSSPERAQDAIKRLSTQPGFCEYPEDFHISKYEIDKSHWVEGFISEAEDRA